MIATSSILNPIVFFNSPQEVYWQTPVKNGPDRGDFFRYLSLGFNYQLFFQADAPITQLDFRNCDGSFAGFGAVTSLGGGLYTITLNFGASPNKIYFEVAGSNPILRSELIQFVPAANYYQSRQTLIQYRNIKAFAGIPSNTLLSTHLNLSFWMQKNPQTYEDIEIAPGEFTRLTNEIHRTLKLELDYSPAYLHEFLQVVLGLDYVFINGREWIMRNDYTYDFNNRHYALAKGQCELTERKSILRNTI
jgi:hypothetical protein